MLINRLKRVPLVHQLSWNLVFIAACLGGVIGIALKFTMLFDQWLYFPFFPNIFDSIFLIVSVIYLAYRSVKR
jgi:hypothetical protein